MLSMSKTLQRLEESPIAAMFNRSAILRSQGIDIIDTTFGEPNFPTPDHIAQAGMDAIVRGDTKYTANAGKLELKQAICEKFKRDYGLTFHPENIESGPGAKSLLFSTFQALVDAGDDIIIPVPAFTAFEGMAKTIGANPVLVECPESSGFKLTPDLLESAITLKSRLLILNSPNNPTGAALNADELRALAKVLESHPNIWIICDDLYEHLMFDGREFVSLAMVAPDLMDRIIIVNGVSKGYSMTGWRLGYLAAIPRVVQAVDMIISQTTSAAPTMTQVAAITALTGPQDELARRVAIYQKRRDLAVAAIDKIDDLTMRIPEGGLFAFVGVANLIGAKQPDGKTIATSLDLSMYLLEEAYVATVPGSAFGADNYIRFSLGISNDILGTAFERVNRAIARLILT